MGRAGTGPRCGVLVGVGVASPADGVATPAEGVASPAEGVAFPAEGVASPAEGVVGVVVGGVTSCTAITGRKFSLAVAPTKATSSSLFTLGAATSIWSLPCTVTEASPTPSESTRC